MEIRVKRLIQRFDFLNTMAIEYLHQFAFHRADAFKHIINPWVGTFEVVGNSGKGPAKVAREIQQVLGE